MRYSDELIQFCLSRHWAKETPTHIAAAATEKFRQKISAREVREILQKWTLRHHGKPVTRKSFGLPKLTTDLTNPKN
jgi:hypothetical protein